MSDHQTTEAPSALPTLTRLSNIAVGLAVAGAVGLGIGMATDGSAGHKIFWGAYHYGFIFWLTLTLGCATLTYLHHTIRSQWSLSILKVLEAGNKNLPLIGVFFIPIAVATVGSHAIFPWADPAFLAKLPIQKQQWLNPIAWVIRAVIYFVFWIWTTSRLNASSKAQDVSRDESLAEARRSFAPPMGVIHVILLTFAFTDWLMSLNPMFFSTLYGAWHMATGILMAIAFGTFLTLLMRKNRPYAAAINPALTKDLGNMMLGFTMVFGYFTLSQFLIIWSGNLPEEIIFFVQRFEGPLVWVGAAIVVFQFFGPFLALLSGKAKRTPELLIKVAGWIFCFRMLDVWWQVVPFFKGPSQLSTVWIDIAALLFVGGVWLYFFFRTLKQNELLPLHDTRLQDTKLALEAH
ncbi:hypothetical protein [Armatimonas rosea]|uniref:Quinol:cytochrome c oxidoreductase quinone-binding subunit 2 n=1 Tax=Armatimonas rosea TaxID=685828 RepID=A0A7W9SSA7_ARMRO|nr:hypothetical protein [Armatimonas rosea]MBB6051074.1 hypothetical protein [Armatimonas rosea]